MFESFNRQHHQQRNSNLKSSLFGSTLIHALVVLLLSLRKSPPTPPTANLTPIPIIVAEQSQERSPLKASGQSKPKSQAKTITSAPKAKTKPNVKKTPTTSPQVKPSSPAIPKSDSPPVLTNGHPQAYAKRYPLGPSFYGGVRVTSNQSNIKAPKITPPKVDPKIEKLVQNDDEIKSSSSAIVNKPRLNPPLDNNPRKTLTSSQSKPLKSETSELENNVAATPKLNNPESTQGKDSSSAINSEESTEGQDDSKTAAGDISDELEQPLAISCEENCQPEYPSVLDGAEGSTGIQLTIDRDGKVIDAAISSSNRNPQLDREALKAAQQMEFTSIDRDRATVRVNIGFTVAGSDFERQAKEEQEEREEQEKERQEQLEEIKQKQIEQY